MLPIQKRYVHEAKEYIEGNYQLSVYQQYLAQNWITVWIYKKAYVLEIIKNIPNDNTTFSHWILGKLFGYSDEAIEEFLEKSYSPEFSVMAFRARGKSI